MAGTSVIQREVTMSAVSISQPVVLTPRPYSSRIQSARLFVSQSKDFTTNRGYITNDTFPDIQRLNISHATDNISLMSREETDQLLKAESSFPNFRLLQRLATSAKARISSNSVNNQINLTCQEDETSKWTNHHLNTTQGDITNDVVCNTTLPCRTDLEPLLPPADGVKDINGKFKGRRSKSQRRHSKFKTKKSTKQPFTVRRNGQAACNHLQPSTSKVIPTFGQRFSKQRRHHKTKQASDSSESSDKADHLHFSLTAYPEYSNRPKLLSHSNSETFNKEDELQISGNFVQEAKLRAIYDTTQESTSDTFDGSNKIKLKKVFQSEKQSGYITQCGRLLPCAPPTSPTLLVLDEFEIIPSLADLRSQQSIKQRLTALVKKNKKRRQVEDQEKKRKDKKILQTQFEAERVRNRQEIYALNKIMTKLEKEHFKKFQEEMKKR